MRGQWEERGEPVGNNAAGCQGGLSREDKRAGAETCATQILDRVLGTVVIKFCLKIMLNSRCCGWNQEFAHSGTIS